MTGRISNTDLFLRALLIAAENVITRWQTEELPVAVRALEQICKQARCLLCRAINEAGDRQSGFIRRGFVSRDMFTPHLILSPVPPKRSALKDHPIVFGF